MNKNYKNKNSMSPLEAYDECLLNNKRIEELEEVIAESDMCSYWYAIHIIKGPFYLAHPTFFNSINDYYKNKYLSFLKEINYDIKQIGEWFI